MGSGGQYWIKTGNMGLSGKYRTTRENMGQRGEILDIEGRYSIETETYWTETGNMRQWLKKKVGEWKIINRDGKYWIKMGNIG